MLLCNRSDKRAALKILSISCQYPNPAEEGSGLFVQRRLKELSTLSEVMILAPVPAWKYGNCFGNEARVRSCLRTSAEDGMRVIYSRWFYPPLGGALNPFCLFARLLGSIGRLRREFPFQVLDAQFGFPEGIASALLSAYFKCPFTVTLRGSELVHCRFPFRGYWMRWALARASRVFAVSEELRQLAIRMGVDPARAKKIPNGINPSVFFPRGKKECRNKHSIPLGIPVALSAGHLIELKGHHRVIAVVKELSKNGIPTQLLIVGGAGHGRSYEQNIRELIVELGMQDMVRLLGQVTPNVLAELMSAADVFCLASSREGWPNVVHEALACGTPVVATDVGGVPDLIPDDRYGFIVPVNDQSALQHALLDTLKKQWSEKVISQWGQSRSWAHVANEVFEQMHEAASETIIHNRSVRARHKLNTQVPRDN